MLTLFHATFEHRADFATSAFCTVKSVKKWIHDYLGLTLSIQI